MACEARLLPDKRHASSSRAGDVGLPEDLLSLAAKRLRSTATVYAFVYFMAAFFPSLLLAEDRARLFESVTRWVPGTLAIGVALGVAALVPEGTILYLFRLKDEGLLFYYGRPARRLSSPEQLPASDQPLYCVLTAEEWQDWPSGRRAEALRHLSDSQGDPLVLVRVLP